VGAFSALCVNASDAFVEVQVMEEKLDNKNVELARVSAVDGKFKIASTAELETIIQRL
jgi:hypothetical protein